MSTSPEDESADVPEQLGQIIDDDDDLAAGLVQQSRVGDNPEGDDAEGDDAVPTDDADGANDDGRIG